MRSVLVTGGTGQLGQTVVPILQEREWNVVAVGRFTSASLIEQLLDVSDMRGVVHLAGGIVAGKGLADHSTEDVEMMIDLNLRSTITTLQLTVPILEANGGGSIVTIGAQAVHHPVPGRALYAATKAAVVALTQAVAEEGRSTNIRANCILPSIIRTEANRAWGMMDAPDDVARWISPEAIGTTIADLLEPTNGISGAVIPMYGQLPF
ncbi:MAG: SDR family NAD(P)-dependent oxidoreductase [Candidatus Kapaibacteriota bacterium]|jgi:3-oxoacyl-[acyl-carrier protein] reductase